MSETDSKTDAPTAEEIKGTKRAAEVSKFQYLMILIALSENVNKVRTCIILH